MTTLWDFLNEPIHGTMVPTALSKLIASSTRDISDEEAKTEDAQRLHAVVYYEDLLDTLIPPAKKAATGVLVKALEEDPYFHRWEAHVYHGSSSFMLPPFINSEMDATSWFNGVLARPALAGVNLVQDPKHNVTSAFTATPYTTADTVPPFIISARHVQNKPIPDALAMKGGPKKAAVLLDAQPLGVLEFKTLNALNERVFANVRQVRMDKRGMHIAVPFLYPDSGNTRQRTKLSKMVIQLFSQMKKEKCSYGLLSSYNDTIFAYSTSQVVMHQGKKVEINILFLSLTYTIGSTSLAPFFAWFLHIFKTPPSNITVPAVNTDLVMKFLSEKELKKIEVLEEIKPGKFQSNFDCGPQTQYTDEYYKLRVPKPGKPSS